MAVIIFSRVFPAYHRRKGQPTYFVEKVLSNLIRNDKATTESLKMDYVDIKELPGYSTSKGHTIRNGKRWKAGDTFSPRFWSDKPYTSKQIQFAPDVKIEKVYDIEIDENFIISIDGFYTDVDYSIIANNDGLSHSDLMQWFKKGLPFTGQIIVWDKLIKY